MGENKTFDGYFYGETAPIEERETKAFTEIAEQQVEDYYAGRMSDDEYNYLMSLPAEQCTQEDHERLINYRVGSGRAEYVGVCRSI